MKILSGSLRALAALAALTAAGTLLPTLGSSQNIKLAPPVFGPNNSYVPMDISSISIDYVFDIGAKKATGVATVKFKQDKEGKPFFDIVPNPTALTVNGEELPPATVKTVSPKQRVTTFRVLDKTMAADTEHEMVISYSISTVPKFGRGTVNAGFFVSDLADRSFFEKFGPTNFQFDPIDHTFNVTVKGASEGHRVFTNGKAESTGDNAWKVVFPSYFNTSTLYFHLVPKSGVKVVEGSYKGKTKTIPVVVYSKTGTSLDKYLRQVISKLGSLEKRFGPTIHDSFTVYVSGSGGMEYSGATITSARAINHELTHSWYARGVFPADGSSSWVDEAVASWQDARYQRASSGPKGPAVKLISSTPYVRQTNRKAYTQGKNLMSQLDYKFKGKGGIVPMLASFYQAHKSKVFTTEMFKAHLEKESGQSMTAIFNKYVYGGRLFGDEELEANGDVYPERIEAPDYTMAIPSMHPRPFTEQELYDLQ